MISGGIYLFGCIIYWIWAQGEIQPWAVQDADTDDSSTKSDDKDNGLANPALDERE
jgi:ACS family sodium-dependent inorganic phosphate cotransporter